MIISFFIKDFDDCSSNPCMNGGTCHDHHNRYSCNCAFGYEGVRCETGEINTVFTFL